MISGPFALVVYGAGGGVSCNASVNCSGHGGCVCECSYTEKDCSRDCRVSTLCGCVRLHAQRYFFSAFGFVVCEGGHLTLKPSTDVAW